MTSPPPSAAPALALLDALALPLAPALLVVLALLPALALPAALALLPAPALLPVLALLPALALPPGLALLPVLVLTTALALLPAPALMAAAALLPVLVLTASATLSRSRSTPRSMMAASAPPCPALRANSGLTAPFAAWLPPSLARVPTDSIFSTIISVNSRGVTVAR